MVTGLSLVADVAGLILPVVTGGGLLIKAAFRADEAAKAVKVINAVDNVADAEKVVENSVSVLNAVENVSKAEDNITLYRSMQSAGDGLPVVKNESSRALGGRTVDLPVDGKGYVYPGTGGLSVAPNTPMNLPKSFRPPELGGVGKDPVWSIQSRNLNNNLSYRPDPINPRHGFIEPSHPMPYTKYQQALASTRNNWVSYVVKRVIRGGR